MQKLASEDIISGEQVLESKVFPINPYEENNLLMDDYCSASQDHNPSKGDELDCEIPFPVDLKQSEIDLAKTPQPESLLLKFCTQLDILYEKTSDFVIAEEQTIKVEDIPNVNEIVAEFLGCDVHGLAEYIMTETTQEAAVIPLATYIELVKRWLASKETALEEHKMDTSMENPSLKLLEATFSEEYAKEVFVNHAEPEEWIASDKINNCLREIFSIAGLRFRLGKKQKHEDLMNELISYVTARMAENSLKGIRTDFDALRVHTLSHFIENSSLSLYRDKKANRKTNAGKAIAILNPRRAGDNLLVEQMQKSIEEYKTLIEYQKAKGEDASRATKLKELIARQLKAVQSGHRYGRGAQKAIEESKEEKIEKALNEIFMFYCRQQSLVGKRATFEQLNSVLSNMNLGGFMKFCKDFGIGLRSIKIKEIFKKTARLAKELDFELFKKFLSKIAHEVIVAKQLDISKKLQEATSEDAKYGLLNESKCLESFSEVDKMNFLYEVMGVPEPENYRKKMVGMGLPFNTRDKDAKPLSFPVHYNSKTRSRRIIGQTEPKSSKHRLIRNVHKPEDSANAINQSHVRNAYLIRRKKANRHFKQDVECSVQIPSKNKLPLLTEKKFTDKPKNDLITKRSKELTWKLLSKLSYSDINVKGVKNEDLFSESFWHDESSEDKEVMRKLVHGKMLQDNESEAFQSIRVANALLARHDNKSLKVNKSMQHRMINKNTTSDAEIANISPHPEPGKKANRNSWRESYNVADVLTKEQLADAVDQMKRRAGYESIPKKIMERAYQVDQHEKANDRYLKILKMQDHRMKKRLQVIKK